MKAILVIDMPSGCEECPFRVFPPFCSISEIAKKDAFEECEKEMPSWCPLKPIPQKGNFEIADDHPFSKAEIMAYTYGITVGRNQVIEEITDESNTCD